MVNIHMPYNMGMSTFWILHFPTYFVGEKYAFFGAMWYGSKCLSLRKYNYISESIRKDSNITSITHSTVFICDKHLQFEDFESKFLH